MSPSRQARSAARLYAVQALFQMEASGQDIDEVRDQFVDHRFGAEIDTETWAEGDVDLFEAILNAAVGNQAKIDQATNRALDPSWPISRIDPTLRGLFRAAGAELLGQTTPPKVVISEFIEIAKAFFPDGKEAGFVNGVLDAVARDLAKPQS